jgi:hypothetical protein
MKKNTSKGNKGHAGATKSASAQTSSMTHGGTGGKSTQGSNNKKY